MRTKGLPPPSAPVLPVSSHAPTACQTVCRAPGSATRVDFSRVLEHGRSRPPVTNGSSSCHSGSASLQDSRQQHDGCGLSQRAGRGAACGPRIGLCNEPPAGYGPAESRADAVHLRASGSRAFRVSAMETTFRSSLVLAGESGRHLYLSLSEPWELEPMRVELPHPPGSSWVLALAVPSRRPS